MVGGPVLVVVVLINEFNRVVIIAVVTAGRVVTSSSYVLGICDVDQAQCKKWGKKKERITVLYPEYIFLIELTIIYENAN